MGRGLTKRGGGGGCVTVAFAGLAVAAVALVGAAPASASTTPIVEYAFPISWNGSGTVADLSPIGNNGTIQGTASVTTTLPAGMSGRSIKTNTGGILTDRETEYALLSNNTVANYDGFSFETWFRWDGTSTGWNTQKIIDYAGTESLQLYNPNGANQTAGEKVQFAFNGATSAANTISFVVSANVWYHAVATFDAGTHAVAADGSLAGTATFSIDSGSGPTTATLNVTKTSQGDDLVRPIGFGLLGLSGNTLVDFNGLIYNPTVSLGVVPQLTLAAGGADTGGSAGVPEPASLGIGCLAAPLLLRRRRRAPK